MANKIDVHQHVVPPCWVAGLQERKAAHRPPAWTPEGALQFMDLQGIATGILSVTAPALTSWSCEDRPAGAREINDYMAGIVARWPTRFGNFATLPLPDIESSLVETRRAFDDLKADGVVILSNYGEDYLGNPLFQPLWEELDRRAAVVFIHPTRLTQPELPGIVGPFVDFPFGTTRTALDMVLKGVMDRHTRMKVILSHGGGFLPYAVHRFTNFSETSYPGSPDAETVMATFRRFYIDTALSSSPSALPSIKAFADSARVLFGSDYPYAPRDVAQRFTAMLDQSALLSTVEHAAVDRTNALALFPRLSMDGDKDTPERIPMKTAS